MNQDESAVAVWPRYVGAIWYNSYNAKANAWRGASRLDDPGVTNVENPMLALDGNGLSGMVIWKATETGNPWMVIRASRFGGFASPAFSVPVRISTGSANVSMVYNGSQLAGDGNGNYLAAWSETLDYWPNSVTYARRFRP